MDLHHNIWLSLPNQDIILGPGMQLCWCQPKHGAYPHLVTESFSRLLRNYGTVLRRKSETFRPSHLLNELSKDAFYESFLIDLFIHIAFNWLIDFILIVCYAHMKIFVLYMRKISFIFIIIIIIIYYWVFKSPSVTIMNCLGSWQILSRTSWKYSKKLSRETLSGGL